MNKVVKLIKRGDKIPIGAKWLKDTVMKINIKKQIGQYGSWPEEYETFDVITYDVYELPLADSEE
jgi:hypothetical protein